MFSDALMLLEAAASLKDRFDELETENQRLRDTLERPRRSSVTFDMSDGTKEVVRGDCQESIYDDKYVVFFDDGDIDLVARDELAFDKPPRKRRAKLPHFAYEAPVRQHLCSQPGCGQPSAHKGLCFAMLPERTRSVVKGESAPGWRG